MKPKKPSRSTAQALDLLVMRLLLVALLIVLMWVGVSLVADQPEFPLNPTWAMWALLPVNLLFLWALRYLYHREGRRLRDVIGVSTACADIPWGMLWAVVLIAIAAVPALILGFAIYGADAIPRLQELFFTTSPSGMGTAGGWLAFWLVGALTYTAINAPVEELLFRGYARERLVARHGHVTATIATSVMFGLQHIVFAPVGAGMVIYAVVFAVWGVAAAEVVRRQGRLFPIIIAHGIMNVVFAASAL